MDEYMKLRKERAELESKARAYEQLAHERGRLERAKERIRKAKPKSKFWGAVGSLAKSAGKAAISAAKKSAKHKSSSKRSPAWSMGSAAAAHGVSEAHQENNAQQNGKWDFE